MLALIEQMRYDIAFIPEDKFYIHFQKFITLLVCFLNHFTKSELVLIDNLLKIDIKYLQERSDTLNTTHISPNFKLH